MAVNVTTSDIGDPRFPSIVQEALKRSGVEGHRLTVEVTESSLIRNQAQVIAVLRELAELGVSVSLDDFGTGYSSLGLLDRLPVSELKIDRGFLRESDRPTTAAIVGSVVSLGRALGLQIVAEGVETAASVRNVARMGCDIAQGYHYARPLAADEFGLGGGVRPVGRGGMKEMGGPSAPLLGAGLERELERLLTMPAFEPPPEFRAQALISDNSVYREAERDFEGWWGRQAEDLLDWIEPWHTVLDQSDAPSYRWFVGGRLNASYNCLDRHVLPAAATVSPTTGMGSAERSGPSPTRELLRDVQALAAGLRARGIGAGGWSSRSTCRWSRRRAVAMLACARIGAPHDVVFLGSSPQTLAASSELLGGRRADHRGRRSAARGDPHGQGGNRPRWGSRAALRSRTG